MGFILRIPFGMLTPIPRMYRSRKRQFSCSPPFHNGTGMHFSPTDDEEFLPVDDFVEKPIKPEELIAKIQKLTT